MKAVVAAFNQEKALVGAFSVITNLRIELFQAPVSVSRWRHCASTPQYASYIFTIMPRKICPFGASKIIIKMSPSALQILSAGAEFAVRGLHSVLPLPSVQCAEYWRGFVCRILAMFAQQGAATGVSGSRALFILRPLSEDFFCFWLCQSHFPHFKNYILS